MVVLLLLAAACANGAESQPDRIALAIDTSDTPDTSTTPDTSDVTDTSDTSGIPDTSATTGASMVKTVPSTQVSGVTGDADGQTDSSADTNTEPFWDVELLGISMVGTGEYVRLTDAPVDDRIEDPVSVPISDPVNDEDSECGFGWLGYLDNGELHRYENLGPIGHTRLFNGPRGQDAIVVSCEESIERVLIQGSAVVPEDGIPKFNAFDLGQPHVMSFDADLGWRGDLFGGFAWRDGFDELVYFDAGSGSIVEAAAMTGSRIEQLDYGFDIVLPDGWEVLTYEAAAVTLAVAPPDARSYISVLSLTSAGDPEFPENAELLDFWTDSVPVWDYVSADRGTIVGSQTRSNWRLSHEGGTLVVQHLEAGDHHLIVHYYVADGEDLYWELAQAVTDQIRHYQYATVG